MSRELRLILWFFAGLFLGGVSVYAHAEDPVMQYKGSWNVYPGSWTTNINTAGAEAIALRNANCTNALCGTGWQPCSFTSVSGATAYGNCPNPPAVGVAVVMTRSWCVDGNFASTGGVCTTPSCPSGQVWDPASGSCVVSNCVVGTQTSATIFGGCYDVDDVDNGCDVGSSLIPPSTICDGSCWFNWMNSTALQPVDCSSPVGSSGPITCTYSGPKTGATCTSSDVAAVPPPSQACPTGYAIGEVNGVKGCYKTGADPTQTTTTTSSTSGDTTTTVRTTVNPATNTTTTTTTTTNNTTNQTSTTVINTPTDPTKPMLNPSNQAPGGGGAGQSPVGAPNGNPSGDPNQNPTCGWPGGPPCKIDESGTPSDGALTAQKADFETKSAERKTFIDSMGVQGDHGMIWDWVFPMPSGSCAPLSYGVQGHMFTIDPCEKLGMVRDMLGFVLYIFTALTLLGIATQTNNGGN